MTATALRVDSLTAGYAGATVVDRINLEIAPGEVVALLGRNGVGKSTTVAAISGTLTDTTGSLVLADGDMASRGAAQRFRAGLRSMRQDQPVVAELTVTENLALAGVRPSAAVDVFPFLESKLRQPAGTLSGGEQKMLALARVAGNPGRVWVLDEPTEGLQPSNVDRCSDIIRHAASTGRAVLLVEQHLAMALHTADRWYLMEKGVITNSGVVDADTFDLVARELAV